MANGHKKRVKVFDSGDDSDSTTPVLTPESSPSPVQRKARPPATLNKSHSGGMSNSFDDDEEIVGNNDDELERRARRRSRMMENQLSSFNSPAGTTAPKGGSSQAPNANVNNVQLAEHYGNCIKLAAENKITSKNAFNLHLIDYMTTMLHQNEIENFQVASSSLDAGAKIYAGRVDAVHQDTYKVLTGLGRTDKGPTAVDDEGAPEGGEHARDPDADSDDEEVGGKGKKSKDKEKRKRNILQKNVPKIRLKSVALQDVDPLFQQQAAAYDEGGTSEQRLNRVRVLDQSSELLLDSAIQLMGGEERPVTERLGSMSDIRGFQDTLRLVSVAVSTEWDAGFQDDQLGDEKEPICAVFKDFKFMGWDKNNDTDPLHLSQSRLHAFNPDSVIPDTVPQPDFSDNDSPDNVSFGSAGGGDPAEGLPPVPEDNDMDTPVLIGSNKQQAVVGDTINTEEADGTMFVSCLKSMLDKQLDNYGELLDNRLGMWAGPTNWKKKTKQPSIIHRRTTSNHPEGSTSPATTATQKKAKKKLVVTQTFGADAENKENIQTHSICVRVVKEDWSKLFSTSRASTVLTDNTVNKNIKRTCLLPSGRRKSKHRNIFQLLNRDVSLLTSKPKAQKNADGTELDDAKIGEFDFDNNRDGDFCPLSPTGGPPPVNEFDDDDDDGGPIGGLDFNDDDDQQNPFDGAFTAPNPASIGANMDLISQPKRVAKIDIAYAKAAKRINVKQVKRVMWNYLSDTVGKVPDTPHDTQESSHSQSIASQTELVMQVPKRLSQLVDVLPRHVNRQTAEDLSVPIVLTCLLYLSNERDLYLSNSENFEDITIRQGLPDHEIEELRTYANRSAATNADVEKRRRAAVQRSSLARQQVLDNWLEGDERPQNGVAHSDSEEENTPRPVKKQQRVHKIKRAPAVFDSESD